ncbi:MULTISPECIES: nucleotidyl transferase AbiEii/AbiGii toxin family protein [unclassified Cryobacterium]|uniref:nucleotidyl transferase AbiEii/AbiGii toxin family protein n=1 Tax=unclassified Cryobacterium TaxID=2649013 RepID=UPI002E0EC6A0
MSIRAEGRHEHARPASQSRSTTDVDLETAEMSIDAAIAQLASAASIDLGDHFEFRYVSHRDTGGTTQPELHAAAITFSVTVRGAGTRNPLKVDLAIHKRTPAAPLDIITPAFRLDMSRLGPAVAYQAIAVEDQIADKVCATLSTYGGQASTRSKDLWAAAGISDSGISGFVYAARAGC